MILFQNTRGDKVDFLVIGQLQFFVFLFQVDQFEFRFVVFENDNRSVFLGVASEIETIWFVSMFIVVLPDNLYDSIIPQF